jgi:hypothetical protein
MKPCQTFPNLFYKKKVPPPGFLPPRPLPFVGTLQQQQKQQLA